MEMQLEAGSSEVGRDCLSCDRVPETLQIQHLLGAVPKRAGLKLLLPEAENTVT